MSVDCGALHRIPVHFVSACSKDGSVIIKHGFVKPAADWTRKARCPSFLRSCVQYCMEISLSFCLRLSLYFRVSLPLCLSVSFCLSLSVSQFFLGLSPSVCLSLFVCLSRNRKLDISRAPTKAKSRESAYSQALVQTKSIGSGSDPESQACRQTVRWLRWKVFGVETGREVGRRVQNVPLSQVTPQPLGLLI